jgi:hypothetical protein
MNDNFRQIWRSESHRNGMHVSRDGQAVTPEVLQGVTDARERLVSHTLNGGEAAAFLKTTGS